MNLNPLTADDSTDAAGDAGAGATGGSNWRRRAGIAAAALVAVGLVRRRRSSGGDDAEAGVNEGAIDVNPEATESAADGAVDDVDVPDAEGDRATADDEGRGIGRRLLATTAGVAVLAVVGRLVRQRN
ncbi:hypothetical protein [Halomicrobium salinisoli]|uniref:hypothetical protein n=1 Tax=Halomicrobium salinisoli TaxID=2878391 RepID=UPI001CF067CA|nr:hypothetical protein [Halomicrobium salinisoli]